MFGLEVVLCGARDNCYTHDTLRNVKRLTSEWELGQCRKDLQLRERLLYVNAVVILLSLTLRKV
jgi:hypothetical protein